MTSVRKKGQTIHSEARAIVSNVINKCDKEAREGKLEHLIKKSNLRAASYTGISIHTVSKIRKECVMAGESSFSTPGKKRPWSEDKKFQCDDFDRRVIRDIINDFYLVQKKVPTVPKLLVAIKEKINFPWSAQTLRRLLHSMGFKWKKCQKYRKILIERPDIVNWRARYLRAVRQYRRDNTNIIYIDESWVDNNLTFGKCWQSDNVNGILTNTSSSNRLILINAGSNEGFVPGVGLIFRAGKAQGDYHGQMNGPNFEKWVNDKLIPNLPERSVIVLDNAPYHCVQDNKPPSKYALKREMIEWLAKNNIPFSEDLKKFDLLELIEKHKQPEKVYRIDQVLKAHGHTVVRLPPYMCDLNPIELAWAKVKRIVREQNITGDLSLKKLEEVTTNAMIAVQRSDWEGFIKHTVGVENNYWEKDGLIEDVIDSFIIELGSIESSDEDEDIRSQSSDDSDLAEPLD